MLYATSDRVESRLPTEPAKPADSAALLNYELHACRKGEETWQLIARFRQDEDARAALWAVVFTGQYAAVKARREGAATDLAEWPAALRTLR
jgi:hypothetical protein